MSNWKRAISFLLTLSLVVGMIPPMAPAARAEEAPAEIMETAEITEPISQAPVAEEPEPTEQQGHASEEPPAPLKASGAYNENGYAYNVDAETGTAIIVDYTGSETELTIPATLGGYPVSTIGENAFYNCDDLTKVVIPSGVTIIDDYAFEYCSALTEIVIPGSVTTIGEYAFYCCYDLTEIVIPDSVTSIGGYALASCDALTSVVLPAGLETLPKCLFSNCYSLTSVVIPNGVTTIDYYAFAECYALTEIVIPDSVVTLGEGAFYYCDVLTDVTLPSGLETLPDDLFYYCRALTEIVIPDSVTTIGENAFYYCDRLTTVAIPSGVTTIGDSAFYSCAALTEIVLPDSVTSLGEQLFSYCYALTDVTLPSGLETLPDYLFFSCCALTEIVIPNSVTTIGAYAFDYCKSLTTVEIPSGVKTIGNSAFYNCYALTDVTLSSGLTSLPENLFYSCDALERIVVPEGVTTIGDFAFAYCDSLNKVEIPNTVTTLGSLVFNGCNTLEEIVLPDSITSVGYGAFYGCSALTNVVLPAQLTVLANSLFYECTSLPAVQIPATVTTIGRDAFYGCTALTEIVIPDSVTEIGGYAFFDCNALVKVAIPLGVTKIEEYSFSQCDDLFAVYILDTMESIHSTAFDGSDHIIIYGVPGSYAETYANNEGIPFVDIASVVRISLVVNDPEGNPISSGYRVEWYTDGELRGTGNTLYGADSEKTHSYQVILEEELVSLYYQPELTEVTLDGENLTLTCTLEPIQTISLTGTLTDEEGQPLAGTVRIRQKFSDTVSKEITVSAQTDGSFTAEIAAVAVVITVSAEGYRNRNLELDLTGNTQPCNLGEQALAKLPTNKITLKLVQTNAAYPGETLSTTTITSFDNLVFTLENVTRGTAITDFTAQYPYLLPAEAQAGGNDVVRITATNTENGTVSEAVTITLDAQATGSGELRFLENGSFVIDALTGNTQHQVMIFDAGGNFVSAATASYNYYSASLPQGSYQVVVMTKTDLLRKVSSLSVLTTYGLEAGTDYAKLDVAVENGVINRIDSLQVPVLDEGRLYYTKENGASFTSNTYSTYAGKYIVVRAEYWLQEKYDTSNEAVVIELPEGLSAVDGSMTVNGKFASYSVQENRVLVNVNQPEGIVRFYLYGTDVGQFSVQANLQFELDGGRIMQPLGTVDLELFAATWVMPEKTSLNKFTISGQAIPNSTLTIFDGDTQVGEATSNAGGSWKTEITLDNPFDYCYHSITVSAYNETIGKTLTSEPQLLLYDTDYISASKVTMYNTGDHGLNTTVFDFVNPGAVPSFRFWPGRYPDFTFVAELTEGDYSTVEKVYVVTTASTGVRTYVECVYDAAKNAWVGTHQYHSSDDVPAGVEVEITRTCSDEIEVDQEYMDQITYWYQETTVNFEKAREERDAEVIANTQLPNTDEMDIDELLAEADKLLTNTEILITESEGILSENLEESGITITTEGSSTTISVGGASVTMTVGTADGKTPESLKTDGYTKLPAPSSGTSDGGNSGGGNNSSGGGNPGGGDNSNGGGTYHKPTPDGGTTVDLTNNQSIDYEIKGFFDEYGQWLSDANKYTNAIADLMSSYLGDVDELNKYQDRLTQQNHIVDKYIKSADGRIQSMKNGGASEEKIAEYEKKLSELQKKQNNRLTKTENLKNHLKNNDKYYKMNIHKWLDVGGKVTGFLGVAGSAYSWSETQDKIKNLDKLYAQLRACRGNGRYDQLGNDIDLLAKQMHVVATLGVGMDAVAFVGLFAGSVAFGVGGLAAAAAVNLASMGVQNWAEKRLNKEYGRISTALKNMDCDGDGQPDHPDTSAGSPEKQKTTAILDPSGYVYEAVPSNRVEGVKAEVYYLGYALDEFGVPKEEPEDILWDAENYDQVNPQYTDKDGRYQWDVPVGQWLVKYSKEGYYDTDSRNDPAANEAGYLPVPPPQVEVNTAIVSKAAPTVESVNAYSDEIQIIFSQYMDLDTVTANTVTVTCGVQTVSGAVQPVNAEFNYEGTEQFASIFRFVPDSTLSGQATIAISGVVNYAGTPMSGDYKQTKSVMPKPRTIAVAESVTLDYNGQKNVEIQVLPIEAGANKTLTIEVMASAIVSAATQTVTTNSEGKATVTLNGELPGSSEIRISLDGTNLTKTITAMVTLDAMMSNTCARVEASIASGSIVTPGTLLTLTTATEGAAIYYTLDGTCPCVVDSPSRMLYTGPIAIEEDMFLIAYAVKDGLEDSKTAGFTYTVCAHTFGDWEIITEATEEEDGLRKHTCTKCGTVETEIIPFDTHTPGDINNDGKVNNKDLTRLFQYLSNWDVEVVEEALDVNGDGKVNNKDLTRLFQYLSNWDVVIN